MSPALTADARRRLRALADAAVTTYYTMSVQNVRPRDTGDAVLQFHEAATAATVLALLDALDEAHRDLDARPPRTPRDPEETR